VITVACVFKTGGDFDSAYVERLARGVHANLNADHKFICLTDATKELSTCVGVDAVVPLQYDWPGWWAKMELFALPGSVLCFDLDTVLVDTIDDLGTWIQQPRDSLLMLRDFYRGGYASGILGWNGNLKWVLEAFIERCTDHTAWRIHSNALSKVSDGGSQFRGDQEWLRFFLSKQNRITVTLAQDIMSGIYSYKVHVRTPGSIPENSRVICFHGRPRPHELEDGSEVKNLWVHGRGVEE